MSQPPDPGSGDGAAPLAVIPVHLRAEAEAELLMRCLVSLWRTAPDVEVVVVDAASPARELAAQLPPVCAEVGAELVRHDEPVTHGAAVNTGLRRAVEQGRDALVIAPDVLFLDEGWLPPLREADGAVVGARLLYPTGLLAHAGLVFSPLHRWFDNRYRFAPADLPEAAVPAVCPVGGSLQLIRRAALAGVGLYDEALRAGRADIDFCLRTFAAGLTCVYEPRAWALIQEPDELSAQDPAFHARNDAATAELQAKHGAEALYAHARSVP
jgi:GT2 family glycosyltransferase